jgi:dihydropteroate synthase
VPKRPLIAGVVNLTPDSFSDGGQYTDPGKCLDHVHQLIHDGADLIEFGAESSRPGSVYVEESEEWERLEPTLKRIAALNLKVKFAIDTRRPVIMRRAVDCGIRCINNIEGLADDSTMRWLAKERISYIAMHMHRTPIDMQKFPLNRAVVSSSLEQFFASAVVKLLEHGFSADDFFLDPGIGFGKTDPANLEIISKIANWSSRYPVAVGVSRKGFLGRLFGASDVSQRDPASKVLEFMLSIGGVRLIRTHDVQRLASVLALKDSED